MVVCVYSMIHPSFFRNVHDEHEQPDRRWLATSTPTQTYHSPRHHAVVLDAVRYSKRHYRLLALIDVVATKSLERVTNQALVKQGQLGDQ